MRLTTRSGESYKPGCMFARLHAVLTELKQRISDEWDKIDQQLIGSAIKQRRKRLAACVSARGGHTEHVLIAEVQIY